jgi:hypothetical protein
MRWTRYKWAAQITREDGLREEGDAQISDTNYRRGCDDSVPVKSCDSGALG